MALEKHELITVYQTMNQFAEQMRFENEIGIKISRKTTLFIRMVIVLFIVASGFILYKTSDLTQTMKHLAANMVEMYNHFGEMSGDVDLMNVSVRNMDQSINGMPKISTNMVDMGKTIGHMKDNVSGMEANIKQMEFKMANISLRVNDMSHRFTRLNSSVYHMQYNTRKMSQPMRNMNGMFPFMR